MKLAVVVGLVLLALLAIPTLLMLPDADQSAFASSQGSEVDAAVGEFEDYPFGTAVGAWVYTASMRSWQQDVFGGGKRRIGATTARELPDDLRRAAEHVHEQAYLTVGMTAAGFLFGCVWLFVGAAIFRWKAAQRGPGAHKGTIFIMLLVLAGFAAPAMAPVVASEGAISSAIYALPIIAVYVVAWFAGRKNGTAAGAPTR